MWNIFHESTVRLNGILLCASKILFPMSENISYLFEAEFRFIDFVLFSLKQRFIEILFKKLFFLCIWT